MIKKLILCYVTMFGMGKFPKIPGTFGSVSYSNYSLSFFFTYEILSYKT